MDFKQPENILELIRFQKQLIRRYWHYMNRLVKEKYKNAALLSYWLRDYLQYLQNEDRFNPRFNIRYQRGQIVYVNFGYRIGSELGGCHYAIVLDVQNSKNNSQLTVVPMKSKRQKKTSYSKVYHVDLHGEIRALLENKAVSISNPSIAHLNELIQKHGLKGIQQDKALQKETADIKRCVKQARAIIEFAENKMNHESIADVGQICTISKMRIVHPIKKGDVLTSVCLSSQSMARIEEKIRTLFFNAELD